jgi:secondary thiamine-phosphate synthase enzyme
MSVAQVNLSVPTKGRGLYEITPRLDTALRESGLKSGIANVFCRHTSASLVIMENADPDVLRDLEHWMTRLVPDGDPSFLHTLEGDDDMPAHIRTALTRSGEAIPFAEGRLLLGTWQGVFLWEHRRIPHTRSVLVTLVGD